MDSNKSIGVFDSGVGGLTVFREIAKALPHENIIYLGDTARVPYGNKSKETVLQYTIQNSLFLLGRGVKAIVIACNTASAYGLEAIQQYFKVPVLGVIEPGARAACRQTKNGRVAVIGTEGTIRSEAYTQVLKNLNPNLDVISRACPLLVPLAEEGWLDGPVVEGVLQQYLSEIKNSGADTLILGCTHYPLFRQAIGKYLGSQMVLVDSAVETASELAELLAKQNLLSSATQLPSHQFCVTDDPTKLEKLGRIFLNQPMSPVQKISL